MERFKYQLALVLAHVFVFLLLFIILTMITFLFYPYRDLNDNNTTFITSIFAIIATIYLFNKGLVYIYPSRKD